MPYCTLFKSEFPMLLPNFFQLTGSGLPGKVLHRHGFFSPRLRGAHRYTIAGGDGIVRPPGALLRRETASLTTGSRGCCASPTVAAALYPSASAASAFTLSAIRIPAVLSISSIICLHSFVASAADKMRFSSLSSKQ